MDLETANHIGHLSRTYLALKSELATYRERFCEQTIDVTGVQVFGCPLKGRHADAVRLALRNELDRDVCRRMQETASALRDHGVEV